MKLYSPDKSLLIDVQAIKEHKEGLVIEGKIMSSMPMKAILKPEEIRQIFKLLTWRTVLTAIKMMMLGRRFSGRATKAKQ